MLINEAPDHNPDALHVDHYSILVEYLVHSTGKETSYDV